jgi:flagellar assembly protein FliH
MSSARPKERLSAYQRWELASLEEQRETAQPPLAPDELERLRERAHEEGYAAGYVQGESHARAQAEAIHGLLVAAQQEMHGCEARIADALLELALAIARHVMRVNLRLRPELVLPVVQEALRALPGFSQGIELVLHPEDAALVREQLAERIAQGGWKVLEDSGMERGGCRLDTPVGAVDATIEMRWQRVVAATGGDERWLE